MFKVAQAARSAALVREGIPEAQLQSARFRPSVRSVPLALGPARPGHADDGDRSRRRVIAAAAGFGFVALVVLVVFLFSGGAAGPGPGGDGSPSPSVPPAATSAPTPGPTVPATPASSAEPGASAAASGGPVGEAGLLAQYQVQEGEALLRIAEMFGVTRRDIILANEGMAEAKPYTQPGDIILVPVSPDLSPEAIAAIEALPGFLGYGDALPAREGSPAPDQ
jgi:hypothetical protein